MSYIRASCVGAFSAFVCMFAHAGAPADDAAVFTLYGAQLSREKHWQTVLREGGGRLVDAYFFAGSLARPYRTFFGDALRFEAEGQVARHFGRQHHWEINAVPVVARWQRFPWQQRIATSTAFGLGLSFATEVPPLEATRYEQSEQLMIHWFGEVTAGPAQAPWAVTLRLHHRSDGNGLLGTNGGMNALGLGVRVRFD
jgi:hypothetical protein